MVPSFLYCLYNNLAFVNLAVFDPTTYFLLLQLRVVVTGIIFQVCIKINLLEKKKHIFIYIFFFNIQQVIFNKQLSGKQWFSLLLLTVGCMMKHINFDFYNLSSVSNINLNINIVLILIQVRNNINNFQFFQI